MWDLPVIFEAQRPWPACLYRISTGPNSRDAKRLIPLYFSAYPDIICTSTGAERHTIKPRHTAVARLLAGTSEVLREHLPDWRAGSPLQI
jgi:hypothetical protein